MLKFFIIFGSIVLAIIIGLGMLLRIVKRYFSGFFDVKTSAPDDKKKDDDELLYEKGNITVFKGDAKNKKGLK